MDNLPIVVFVVIIILLLLCLNEGFWVKVCSPKPWNPNYCSNIWYPGNPPV